MNLRRQADFRPKTQHPDMPPPTSRATECSRAPGFDAPLFRRRPLDLQSLNASSSHMRIPCLFHSCADNSSPSATAHRVPRRERRSAQRLDPVGVLERSRLLSPRLARLHSQALERELRFVFRLAQCLRLANGRAHPCGFRHHKDGALSSESQPFLIRLPKSARQ